MIRYLLVLLLSLVVLLLELPLAANKEEYFKHIRQRDTFDKARRICYMREQALVNAYSLEKYITQNQFDMLEGTYWLPLEKKTLQEWHTLSKQIVDERYQARGQDCAMIHTLDEMVDSTYCHVKLEGHICSNIGSSSCPVEAVCFKTGTDMYGIFHMNFSWNEAQNDCHKRNASLAEFISSSSKNFLATVKSHVIHHGRYAVGLHKVKWMSVIDDVSMVVNRWAKDEPAFEKSCAVLHTKSLTWKAVNCDEEHNYVCSNTSATTSRQGDNFCRSSPILLIIHTLTVLLTSAIVLFILICIILKQKKNILLKIQKLSKEANATATGKEHAKTDRSSTIKEDVGLLPKPIPVSVV